MAVPRKAPARHGKLTRDQLAKQLQELQAAAAAASFQKLEENKRLVHDLQVHQVELELQNHELLDAQALLQESRGRLTDLYDFAPVVYFTLDQDGRILEANLTAAALFGIERGRLVGKSLASLVASSQRPALRRHIHRCFHERTRVESELALSIRAQPIVIAHVVSVPYIGDNGTVTGCKTMLVDITALKRAQEKLAFLAEASATLASSFDWRATLAAVAHQAVPVLADICVVDLVGADGGLQRLEIAFADPDKAARLAVFRSAPARTDEDTAVGKAIRTKEALLFPECSPTSLASTDDGYDHELLVKVSGARSMMVVPMLAREAVHGVITLIAAESGRQYSGTSLSTACDLAAHAALAIDNARLYERARDAIRAREDMLSFVSHDLRNPLMGIQLTVETLLKSVPEEERRKGWKQLERIRRGARQMRRMIDDLLDVASLDAGRLTLTSGAHEAARIVDEAVAMLAPLAVEKGIALAFQAPVDPLVVRCDRERVIQVLSNVIGNAIKFTPAGGSVTVAAGTAGAQALFSVHDTGSGISPEVRPHIFERFWQAQETAQKGRGLGLYIAKGLVETQGGAIWVDSSPGGGTTFSFTLPLASAAEAASLRPAADDARRPLAPGRVARPE